MKLKRREFLHKAAGALAAMGQLGTKEAIAASAPRYYATLAQPTSRKLALLVGINQYPSQGALQGTSLHGCVTDVELQRELLIYRFGFVPSDILTLTDSEATRENIEGAFLTHLRAQAKDGDIVVFHFSGYGSRVSMGTTPETMQNSLVPADDLLPTQESPIVNDLLEDSLWLMLRSLPTPHAIAVLDTSYTYPGTDLQGNLRIRSRARPTIGQPTADELAFIAQLKSQVSDRTSKNITLLTAAAPSQLAAEQTWNNFTAGLFTYALTQTLWSATPATQLLTTFSRAANTVEQLAGFSQQPQLIRKDKQKEFALLGSVNQSADGAVTAVEENKTVQLWLAGLSPAILDAYGVNSLFTLVPTEGSATSSVLGVQIRSRIGFVAKAQIKELNLGENATPPTLSAGQLIQEAIRVLPRNINLIVAIDSRLERIERVDATSAFAVIPQVSAVVGEQPADYRLSRVPATTIAQMPNTPLPDLYKTRYALFSLNQTLIPNTVGEGGEAVKVAVQRLTPQLKTLLAAKILRLTANEESSLLRVKATLATIAPEARVLVQREPLRVAVERRNGAISHLPTLPVGARIQYRLENLSDRPVYFMVFCLDSAGRAFGVNPVRSVAGETDENTPTWEQQAIAPGESVSVPALPTIVTGAIDTFGWTIHCPSGLAETQIIFSQAPFTQTFTALDGGVQPVRDTQGLRVLLNPLKVAHAVLEDLHNASIPEVQKSEISTDDFALNVKSWSTLSFIYRVI